LLLNFGNKHGQEAAPTFAEIHVNASKPEDTFATFS